MKVSIIIPTYNYAHYIFDALKSVEEQEYPKELLEVIIVDDGSTDDTPNLFKNYKGALNLTYHYQTNSGKANATQKGIDLCSGEIIFNLDADDYFYSNKIKSVVAIYQKYPEVSHVAHPAEIIEKGLSKGLEAVPVCLLEQRTEGKKLISYFLKNRLLYGGGSTFSARANVLKARIIPKDVDMYIDEYLIYQTGFNGSSYFLKDGLSVWRVHGENYSVNQTQNQILKNKRLLASSTEMLNYVKAFANDQQILRLYQLKHLDRYLNIKETNNSKNSKDILTTIQTIFSLKYSLKDLWTYRIYFRLLPHKLLAKMKGK